MLDEVVPATGTEGLMGALLRRTCVLNMYLMVCCNYAYDAINVKWSLS